MSLCGETWPVDFTIQTMAGYSTVCAENDVPPGEGRHFVVGGIEIALFRLSTGTFHATENTCLHAGGPLHEGTLEGATVTCPWHAWQYDVTDGSCGLHGGGLTCYPTRVVNGTVEVALSGLAEDG